MLPAHEPLVEMAHAAGLAGASIVLARLERAPQDGVSEDARLDPDAERYPASMIKTPIAACLADAWAGGAHGPGERVPVAAANMTSTDKPSPLVPGYEATLEELARLMIVRSDNVATNVLIDVLGRSRISAFCREAGLARTAVHRKLSGSLPLIVDPEETGRNSHPASDAALLFGAIARRQLAGSVWLEGVLAAQEWNDKLSLGLLPGDRFAHKTGDTDEVSHDGGILDTVEGRRYLIVVYTALPSSPQADARFGAFMRALRPLL
jgi:beta-lactamase class A